MTVSYPIPVPPPSLSSSSSSSSSSLSTDPVGFKIDVSSPSTTAVTEPFKIDVSLAVAARSKAVLTAAQNVLTWIENNQWRFPRPVVAVYGSGCFYRGSVQGMLDLAFCLPVPLPSSLHARREAFFLKSCKELVEHYEKHPQPANALELLLYDRVKVSRKNYWASIHCDGAGEAAEVRAILTLVAFFSRSYLFLLLF